MSFKAEIVADSKNEFGNRITTFVVTFPRIILAEFNTHRMLSRNSASSRAIPFAKMVEAVEKNPFIPIAWQKDHKGMQGTEYFNDRESELLKESYLRGRDHAVATARILYSGIGESKVTKQICNRGLEPYMWHTCIVTGTEWANFFGLRAHPAAEIHMQQIANMMLEEYNNSTPKLLQPGDWHIPFESRIDETQLMDWDIVYHGSVKEKQEHHDRVVRDVVKISTVMAARTSYTVVGSDQKPMEYSRMIELHDEMRDAWPKHMSPFDHCAQCMDKFEYENHSITGKHICVPLPADSLIRNSNTEYGWCGNFRGFKQYRKMIHGENIDCDPRIKQK